jgi:hypothetical protein
MYTPCTHFSITAHYWLTLHAMASTLSMPDVVTPFRRAQQRTRWRSGVMLDDLPLRSFSLGGFD